ncbi:E3 ubiquitin-protein ligase RNF14-like [Eucyclogobius newberryi]|uniref:E3 ubiquitin-protein ligase RNF14-like n=1 Tax=Eucyclogobius newberryi TaxID=166745 RepID=UPI003B5CB603
MSSDLDEQHDERLALLSIFEPDEFVRSESEFSGEFRVRAELPSRFTVTLNHGGAVSQYEITSLPPLRLTFDLPEDYPSCSPPAFTLHCSWLTPKQLSSLTAKLDDLYRATGGAVVLFSWAQFLKCEMLTFLGVTNNLDIPSDWDDSGRDRGSAAGANAELPPSLTPGQALLSRLLIHDAAQTERAFAEHRFECGVCFESRPGFECVRLGDCGHVFCRACLAEFCKVQIVGGNARAVTCVLPDCDSAPTPEQVRSLVGEELFRRYDRLLLQDTLDSMPDVVYCPRPSCASAVLAAGSMALCTACSFAFCVLCKKTYHGTEACYTPTPASAAPVWGGVWIELPKSQEGRTTVWEDYTSGSKKRKKLLEKRYGRHTLQNVLESGLSQDWISANSKSCPHCFSRIEKNGGCNFMTCRHCQRCFCWNCFATSWSNRNPHVCPRPPNPE